MGSNPGPFEQRLRNRAARAFRYSNDLKNIFFIQFHLIYRLCHRFLTESIFYSFDGEYDESQRK